MNPRLGSLHTYPFEKLGKLLAGAVAPAQLPAIALSIGEPQHEPPPFVLEALRQGVDRLGAYPATAGSMELRSSAARWLERRFTLRAGSVDAATMVLPVNGTREALFALVQAVVDPGNAPIVITPNPFYQIYEGAALLAGATPYYLNATADTQFAPDLDSIPKAVLDCTQVLFLCSPGNPTGAVLHENYLGHALDLAERHDFIVAADECYAEIFADEAAPPPSLLEVAQATGRDRFERCIVFHSLSKRSSVPGLRSGFVAGDPQLMRKFLLYRTYQGGAMSPMVQMASRVAWDDDAHVRVNRQLYREKFERVLPILSPVLDVRRPDGAFYLWVDVGGDDERFTRELFARQNVTVLPGSYLARTTDQGNPGAGRIRLSLTATVEDCVTAATRIRDFISGR
ncbi:MAG TPA: succinyldiaminopimelate transaminase [Steroidobacteraceae bacterium]|jgi:N-succinyldiaminopimelate aminotransferase|nr:succinyldiaminopimelate transaminase [Steroidobacteraceae bacterium]